MDKNGQYESFKEIVEDKCDSKYDAYQNGIIVGTFLGFYIALLVYYITGILRLHC